MRGRHLFFDAAMALGAVLVVWWAAALLGALVVVLWRLVAE